MLNHLSWQKFRKSLISMASWDAKKGGNPQFYCRKIFLQVVFHEHDMSVIWNSLAPWLEIIYCRKAQWWTRKYHFAHHFWLEFVCLKEQDRRNTALNAGMVVKGGYSPLGCALKPFPLNLKGGDIMPHAKPAWWLSQPWVPSVSLEQEPVFGRCACWHPRIAPTSLICCHLPITDPEWSSAGSRSWATVRCWRTSQVVLMEPLTTQLYRVSDIPPLRPW